MIHWNKMLLLVALVMAGCSNVGKYLDFWKAERTAKKEFSIDPSAKLLRELQPGDSFLIKHRLDRKIYGVVTDSSGLFYDNGRIYILTGRALRHHIE